jgi:hypothetical protein
VHHAQDELSMSFLVALSCNAEKLLPRHASLLEFTVGGCIVYRYKAVGFEEVKEFVKEEVGVDVHEAEEVLNIILMEKVQGSAIVGTVSDHVASILPEMEDVVPGAQRKVTA